MVATMRTLFSGVGVAACLALPCGLTAAAGTSRDLFANATEQRLFILKDSIEEKPGTADRIDVQVYAIIVNACRFCAETYVFVETKLHRGRSLGAFECNHRFAPLQTFSNGLKDFACARESEAGRITRYQLKYNGERYIRERAGR